ncbi:MAG TPA: YggS family pyridoxal phosphate-dependent enzyme [Deltaproteobacteria bacterium]|jgi:pyridoxal phosphate enzyme (YggS family)|nr:MAG: YggS family pyridoxal phosphate-dependent enzyme [Pseudomonadota bacterium]HBM53772.1 YggS family pyridoxal phosphate-dependent enzyme [Deltaproteobacteria bacterium]|tara:strand:- start:42167 stop:42874 length:708 start_codon:yes stop_codon:yes gene_type:complete
MSLKERLTELSAELAELATEAGRSPEEIKLIAVSKTHPSELIAEAFQAGQVRFGENRVQEASEKIERLQKPGIEWHLIGHLQKNKARFCPGRFDWIHSVDSQELLELLEKQCALQRQSIQILLQANLSQEDSKSGVSDYDNLCRLLEKAQDCQWLSCRGLMTMAAATDDANEIRRTFAQLRTWLEKLRNEFNLTTFTELSMGMSSDYRIAIAEGATMIRLGTALFGERAKPLIIQ